MKRYSSGILIKSNKILLGKRSAQRALYPGVWDFIGGHCEENESYDEAMTRELSEEIGVEPLDYELVTKIDRSPEFIFAIYLICLLYTSPSPRDQRGSRMPSSA